MNKIKNKIKKKQDKKTDHEDNALNENCTKILNRNEKTKTLDF